MGTLAASEAGKSRTLTAAVRDGPAVHGGVPVWMRARVCSEKGCLFVILTKVSDG